MGELAGSDRKKKLGILVQARTGSTRLPGKVLKAFSNNHSILDLLLIKLKHAFPEIPLVVCTSTLSEDDAIVTICELYDVSVYRGSETDVLDRLLQAAYEFNFENVLRVCADNPFLEIQFIHDLIAASQLAPSHDYYSFRDIAGTPVIKTHYGLFAELVSRAALEKVVENTSEAIYREHVTNYVYTKPGFSLKFLELPESLKQRTYLRFTLDDKEDFELLRQLYRRYSEFNFNLEKLLEHIDQRPSIIESMQQRIQKYSK